MTHLSRSARRSRSWVAVAGAVALAGFAPIDLTGGSPQEVDRRVFDVVTSAAGAYSIYVPLADDLPGAADRSSRIAVQKLTDSLYLRVIPESHTQVRKGAFAYFFQLAGDAAGSLAILAIDQPKHGPSADLVRAADFRNSDNSAPNAVGPKNVNAAGEVRTISYGNYIMEIRVLSFEIAGLGPSQVPAFAELSCLVTIRSRSRLTDFQAPPSRQVEGWSQEVNGLQARLTLVDKGRLNGRRWLVPYLELRNVRDLASAMEVNLDGRHLQVELVGEEGKPLGLRPRPGHSGPVGPLGTVTLPRDSTIRISLEIGGWLVPRDAAAIVDTRNDGFAIYEQEKGKVFLRATVTAEKTETSPEWKTWIGTIHTPLLKVDW